MPKVIYTCILGSLAKLVKSHLGIIAHQLLTERSVRRIKEGTSAVLLESCLDEKVVG